MNASLHATLTASTPAPEVGSGSAESEVIEAVVTELMADEVVVLELQDALGCPPAQANPETVAGMTVFHGVQGAVDSTASYTTPPDTPPQLDPEWFAELFDNLDDNISEGGAGSERQEPRLP
eukprot:scaffold27369_cov69-Phaeocystis_antarctica.AAC.1